MGLKNIIFLCFCLYSFIDLKSQQPLIQEQLTVNYRWHSNDLFAAKVYATLQKILFCINRDEKAHLGGFFESKTNAKTNLDVLKTQRLTLRQWTNEDFEPFARLNADPKVMEYYPNTLSREESDLAAQMIKNKIEEEGWGRWAVSILGSTDFIGTIGLYKLDYETFPTSFSPAIAIGWRICVDHWGKGYATEGAKAALEYGFSKLQLKEIVATCAVENAGSRKVMEKIGMKYDPENDFTLPNVPIENKMSKCVLYRITKKEWENRANNP
jgi:RimJ/RimL family protein N-acetyltransferase